MKFNKIYTLLFLIILMLSTSSVFSAAPEWYGKYSISDHYFRGTLEISDAPADCMRPIWCDMIVRYYNSEGKRYPARIKNIDRRKKHMVFYVSFPDKEQRFDAYLTSNNRIRLSGIYPDRETRFNFYAISLNVAFYKNEKGDLFGNTVATGDFNNDGISDLAIAAPGKSQGDKKNVGAVYIYMGRKNKELKISLALSEDVLKRNRKPLGKNEKNDFFGSALAIGDFNNDQYDDLAIGAMGESSASGAVFLFKGTRWGLEAWDTFGQEGLGKNERGDKFGFSLATGDFNNDNKDDLAVGAPGEAPGSRGKSGFVFLYKGSSTGLKAWKSFGQKGLSKDETGDQFGYSLASGDFNNDNRDDLAVGAPGDAPSNDPKSGSLFIFKGSQNNLTAWKSYHQEGFQASNEADDQFGHSLASGDFNGDGTDDLAVGTPGESPGNEPKSGNIFVFKGTSKGLRSWVGFDQNAFNAKNENGDRFGHSLTSGDFNGDGKDDLVIGTPGEAPGNDPKSGNIFVFKGTSSGLKSWVGFDQNSFNAKNENGDLFGYSLASGDFNGDKKDDLVVGTPGEAPGNDPKSGNVFLFKGTSRGLKSWFGFDQEWNSAN